MAILGSSFKKPRAQGSGWSSGAGTMANPPTPLWIPMLEGLAAVERLFMGLLAEDMGRDERNRLEELYAAVLETLRGQAISAVLVANGALADAGFSPLSVPGQTDHLS